MVVALHFHVVLSLSGQLVQVAGVERLLEQLDKAEFARVRVAQKTLPLGGSGQSRQRPATTLEVVVCPGADREDVLDEFVIVAQEADVNRLLLGRPALAVHKVCLEGVGSLESAAASYNVSPQ